LSKETNQWSEANDDLQEKVDALEKTTVVDCRSLQEMSRKLEQNEKQIEQGSKGRVTLKQINSELKADLEVSKKREADSQKISIELKNEKEGLIATKNSMKKNMNDVMSKLQEWLNGGMTGDQITQYCAEMGFQFYPGFNLPNFPNSSPNSQDDGNDARNPPQMSGRTG
jgi:chromosome segregation ATPase